MLEHGVDLNVQQETRSVYAVHDMAAGTFCAFYESQALGADNRLHPCLCSEVRRIKDDVIVSFYIHEGTYISEGEEA